MKYKSLLFVIALFSFHFVSAQAPLIKIEESDMNNPNQIKDWVLNTLNGGGGEFDTLSIKFTGSSLQLGKFSYNTVSDSTIGLDSGLVISTGKVKDIQSYNSSPFMSNKFSFNGQPDPDLDKMYETILGLTLFPPPDPNFKYTGDAAVIEFDYKPYGSVIELRYVFGSEEYKYWMFPAPPPNDVDLTSGPYDLTRAYDMWGISINRPNRPFVNLAVLPILAGGADVNVHTVNDVTLSAFYQGNPPASTGGSYGVQFDGFTKNMDALLIRDSVTPCVTYHVKIAIEDFLGLSDPNDPDTKGYYWDSGIFLGGGSFVGGPSTPTWTTSYEWTSTHSGFEGKLIEGGCNDLLVTFTLEYAFSGVNNYYIPFKIESGIYRDNVFVTYEGTGEVLAVDSVTFNFGETTKTIRLSAINLNADVPNVRFVYPQNPCERPHPPIGGGSFNGKIPFELVNNEPFSFTVNPKEYSAYCKETIPLTLTDVTNGGVNPVVYIWPTNPTPPVDVYNYTVNASPDWVTVEVKDLCGNDTTTKIKINNKPIHLLDIPPLSFCKPGMQQDVTVHADPNFNDFPGYGFSNVDWLNLWYTPPQDLGSGNPKTIVYDDVIGEDVYFIKYNVTDVCGGKTTDTLKVDQTGKLDLGDDKYLCEGESVELINYTPVFNNDPNNYKWYIKTSPTDSTIIGTGNSIIVTPLDTTMYYLYIYDKCEQSQIDSLIVFVDHFKPQISIAPSSAEVCPGESVTLSANKANDYLWNPGGYTTQDITVAESTPGIYSYTLTASSDYCIDKETSASYQVFPSPEAVFALTPDQDACTGENIQFTYSSDTIGKEFDWDFGDGSTSILPNPVHAYGNEGLYTVNLHVQQYICDNDTSRVIEVNPLPTPDFSADVLQGCLPVEVQFQDQTADVAPGATYEWTFGDGNTSGQQNPANQYTTPGLFTVSLTVHNTARCAATSTKPNYIQANPNPVAKFEADPWITTLDTPDIDFSDLSASDSTITGYEWDFGDGTTSTEENPTHTYLQAGEYDVVLYIETVNGCMDTTIAKVALTEEVKLYIPNAFTPNGDGINDVFEIKGTPISNFNLYIYDRWGKEIWSTHNFETRWDGTDFSGKAVPPGSYIYKVLGTDYLKRDISFTGTVTVVK